MPLYQIKEDDLEPLSKKTFQEENFQEKKLQRLFKNNIASIAPDVLIIAEEFCDWEESSRRIDLLGVDKNANLVVIELKRTDDGGHMELQAIRYAAMISGMSWNQAIETYEKFLCDNQQEADAKNSLLNFLDWEEPNEDFGKSVRIILASANFSKEITASVLWLNEKDLDITCVRLSLYKMNENLILSADQIIPLQEAESYQIKLKQKRFEERGIRNNLKDRSLYTLCYQGEIFEKDFRKADIAYHTLKLLEEKKLMNNDILQFLREDKSSSFQLLKTFDEISDNEKKYRKYRFTENPEITYNDVGYYIARNWGIISVPKFIEKIEKKFPDLSYT